MENSDKWDKNQKDAFNKAAYSKENINFKLTPEAVERLRASDAMRTRQLAMLNEKQQADTAKDVEKRLNELMQDHPVMQMVPKWVRSGRTWDELSRQARADVAANYQAIRKHMERRSDDERARIVDYYRTQADIIKRTDRDEAAPQPTRSPELAPALPGPAPDLSEIFNARDIPFSGGGGSGLDR